MIHVLDESSFYMSNLLYLGMYMRQLRGLFDISMLPSAVEILILS
jgi:hypothetical protein